MVKNIAFVDENFYDVVIYIGFSSETMSSTKSVKFFLFLWLESTISIVLNFTVSSRKMFLLIFSSSSISPAVFGTNSSTVLFFILSEMFSLQSFKDSRSSSLLKIFSSGKSKSSLILISFFTFSFSCLDVFAKLELLRLTLISIQRSVMRRIANLETRHFQIEP